MESIFVANPDPAADSESTSDVMSLTIDEDLSHEQAVDLIRGSVN